MKVNFATISKTGKRANNEDAFCVIDEQEEGRWFGIVCDGMGGHAMGEVASETVVKAISEYWKGHTDEPDSEGKVAKARRKASAAIDERSFYFNHCQMGTTMVMASIVDGRATIAHIGDSRCYLLRKGHFDYEDIGNSDKDHVVYQTKDHTGLSFGWEVVEKCFFSYKPEVAVPDVVQFDLQPGDILFLCSDGIYKSIAPSILKARLMDDKSPEEILDVIDFLCEKNGDDNYTAIFARIEE